jgi:hypothetical protein
MDGTFRTKSKNEKCIEHILFVGRPEEREKNTWQT